MPANSDETQVHAQLAALRQQVAGMVDIIARIEVSVREIVSLDRTIAGMQADYKHQTAEVIKQWQRIDETSDKQIEVDRKVEKWINTGRGAYLTLLLLWTLIQAGLIGAGAWIFSNVQDARTTAALIDNRLSRVEADLAGVLGKER